ncbi:MAG: amidase [Proteobacteria bacterium]|nr:amidase [Pseudomonadota bacterium]
MAEDLLRKPALELAALIRRKDLSAVELIERSLERIRLVNPHCNAFCAVYGDEALEAARRADLRVASGAALGPLHGLPVAIKDFTPVRGKLTTRGSVAFADWVPEAQPVIVDRLLNAGAILIGRTTTPEFAHSSFTRSPLWGDTRNPWNLGRTSGGSSGGSAVAVATGCAALAEGTDMGGSVRIPAAFCGTVGLKPSLGRIPMDILPTAFDSISHFGPLARTIDDAALFMNVAAGPDDGDPQSLPASPDIAMPVPREVSGLRLALSVDLGFYRVQPEVEINTRRAVDFLADKGAIVEPIELPWTREIVDAWADYWGVFLAASFGDTLQSHRDELDPAVVQLMEKGFSMSALAFKRIEILRTRMWRDLAGVLRDHDALICPTTAQVAPPIDMNDSDFESDDEAGRFVGLDMTCPFNFVGQCPALSVPSGLTPAGLPTGIQIVGRRYDEPTVLRIGAALQGASFVAREMDRMASGAALHGLAPGAFISSRASAALPEGP